MLFTSAVTKTVLNISKYNMKILVFSDFHGDVDGMHLAIEISHREAPDKTVICGDLFSSWSSTSYDVANLVSKLVGVLYLVRGNNDRTHAEMYLPCSLEEYAVMYHFGRTLFFTHGDRYNGYRVPPMLTTGDAIIHGHTHIGQIGVYNGLYVLNVGSLCRPRGDLPNYLVLDEDGATLKDTDGQILRHLDWKR